MPFWVYILASKRNGTLYVGRTNDIARRIYEHRSGAIPGFTRKYGVKTLVHIERYDDIGDAVAREHRLKRWRRRWKLALIEERNPDWRDLCGELNR